jgi:hypothetical protein
MPPETGRFGRSVEPVPNLTPPAGIHQVHHQHPLARRPLMKRKLEAILIAVLVIAGCDAAQGIATGAVASASPAPAPTASPMTSPAAVTSPAASAGVTEFPGYSDEVAPGTYVWRAGAATPADIAFTIPSGWQSRYAIPHKDRGGPGEIAVGNWIIANVYADPCHWQGSLLKPAIGPTVDDLAAALVAQKGRDATAPTDVTLGGYPAKRVELSIPADLDRAACDEGAIRTWVAPGESGDAWTPDPEDLGMHPGQVDVVYIIDIEGDRLIIDTWHMPGTSAADLAELESILASLRIEP